MDLSERLILALSRAEDAVSRLDERVRACPFRAGWLARLDVSEAVAWGWNAGSVVSAEDLNLHDENMDVRMPGEALRAAHNLVRARRKASAAGPELLTPEGAAWLSGRRRNAPSPALIHSSRAPPSKLGASNLERPMLERLTSDLERLRAGVAESADEAVTEWLAMLKTSDGAPCLLNAAAALEGWRIVEAYPREGYVGPILVGQWLRLEKRLRSHLLGFEAGLRVVSRARPGSSLAPAERILFWLGVIYEAAVQAAEELNRLDLARQVAIGRAGSRRAHSHLGAMIDLFLERTIVTAPMAAQRLKVSPHSARRLIGALGGSVTEISGQSRFRAWRL